MYRLNWFSVNLPSLDRKNGEIPSKLLDFSFHTRCCTIGVQYVSLCQFELSVVRHNYSVPVNLKNKCSLVLKVEPKVFHGIFIDPRYQACIWSCEKGDITLGKSRDLNVRVQHGYGYPVVHYCTLLGWLFKKVTSSCLWYREKVDILLWSVKRLERTGTTVEIPSP